jgi:hypothetical protein
MVDICVNGNGMDVVDGTGTSAGSSTSSVSILTAKERILLVKNKRREKWERFRLVTIFGKQ